VEKEDILKGKIDSLMRRLEKMEIEKKEAQNLKVAEVRSTCEECGEYGHVHKDCPEEAKVLDYMRKGICRTSATGKVYLNLMQAHPFRIRFRFVYN
jgi:peptide methionine sulfoxide reductase MsrB